MAHPPLCLNHHQIFLYIEITPYNQILLLPSCWINKWNLETSFSKPRISHGLSKRSWVHTRIRKAVRNFKTRKERTDCNNLPMRKMRIMPYRSKEGVKHIYIILAKALKKEGRPSFEKSLKDNLYFQTTWPGCLIVSENLQQQHDFIVFNERLHQTVDPRWSKCVMDLSARRYACQL